MQHNPTYTRVTGSVSIQKMRSVPYRYGELWALLVYLTTVIHVDHEDDVITEKDAVVD